VRRIACPLHRLSSHLLLYVALAYMQATPFASRYLASTAGMFRIRLNDMAIVSGSTLHCCQQVQVWCQPQVCPLHSRVFGASMLTLPAARHIIILSCCCLGNCSHHLLWLLTPQRDHYKVTFKRCSHDRTIITNASKEARYHQKQATDANAQRNQPQTSPKVKMLTTRSRHTHDVLLNVAELLTA